MGHTIDCQACEANGGACETCPLGQELRGYGAWSDWLTAKARASEAGGLACELLAGLKPGHRFDSVRAEVGRLAAVAAWHWAELAQSYDDAQQLGKAGRR